jgi:hypothetical protein
LCKFSEEFLGRLIIALRRFFLGQEATKVEFFVVNRNRCAPATTFPHQGNSLKKGAAIPVCSAIAGVLRACAFAKIGFSIIQCVPVNVIAFFKCKASEYLPVHPDLHPRGYASPSHRVECSRVCVPLGYPVPRRKSLKILGINKRILSLRERDQAVRWIRRLGDCVSFHAAFVHRSSLKGLLQLSRYSIIPLFLLSLPIVASGQGVRIGNDLTVTSALTTPGPISTVPNSQVNICTYPANAVPCTNKAVTYTSITLGTPCSSSTQVVLSGTNSCVANTDVRGNWGAWVAAGAYDITITVSTGQSMGPFTLTAGAGGGPQVNTINTWTADNFFTSGVPWISVGGFGAVCDGSHTTADTAAFQAAMTFVGTHAGVVHVDKGSAGIVCDIDFGTITWPTPGSWIVIAFDFSVRAHSCLKPPSNYAFLGVRGGYDGFSGAFVPGPTANIRSVNDTCVLDFTANSQWYIEGLQLFNKSGGTAPTIHIHDTATAGAAWIKFNSSVINSLNGTAPIKIDSTGVGVSAGFGLFLQDTSLGSSASGSPTIDATNFGNIRMYGGQCFMSNGGWNIVNQSVASAGIYVLDGCLTEAFANGSSLMTLTLGTTGIQTLPVQIRNVAFADNPTAYAFKIIKNGAGTGNLNQVEGTTGIAAFFDPASSASSVTMSGNCPQDATTLSVVTRCSGGAFATTDNTGDPTTATAFNIPRGDLCIGGATTCNTAGAALTKLHVKDPAGASGIVAANLATNTTAILSDSSSTGGNGVTIASPVTGRGLYGFTNTAGTPAGMAYDHALGLLEFAFGGNGYGLYLKNTGSNHGIFDFSNLTAPRNYTWPDAAGTPGVLSGAFTNTHCLQVTVSGGVNTITDAGAVCSSGSLGTSGSPLNHQISFFSPDPTHVTGLALPPDSQTYTACQSGTASDPALCLPGIPFYTQACGSPVTLASSDRGKVIIGTGAGACAVTLPQAGSAGFNGSWETTIKVEGAGTWTITPTISTINGGANYAIVQGKHCTIGMDGSNNYHTVCATD